MNIYKMMMAPGLKKALWLLPVLLIGVTTVDSAIAKEKVSVPSLGETKFGNYLAGRHAQFDSNPRFAIEYYKSTLKTSPDNKALLRRITTLLVGHVGPLNYGAEYKERYDSAFQELAARYDVEFYPFYFETLMASDGVTPDLQNYFQADGLHPNAEGVAAVVADMGPYVLRALGR